MQKFRGNQLTRFSNLSSAGINTFKELEVFGNNEFRQHKNKYKFDKGLYTVPYINEAELAYIKNGEDWSYHVNEMYFRNEFDLSTNKVRAGFFGCSFTFGEGIDYKNTFVNLISQQFDFSPFNFGIGGSSIERVARTFSAAVKFIEFDIAIFTLPSWERQFYTEESKIINLIPGWPHKGFEKICKLYTKHEDEYYITRAVTNINWIMDIAKYKNIKIILTSWDHPTNELCKCMHLENTLDPFPNIDNKCARDDMHPGIKSQTAHADQIIKAINDRAWF